MLDFTKLWDKTYLLGPNPLELQRSDIIFFGIALTFILIGAALKIWTWRLTTGSPKKILVSRFFHSFTTTGILVLLWAAFRFENIPLLSTHIVALALLLIWLVWLIFIFRYFFRDYRTQQRLWEEEKVKRKYLP